MNTAIATHWQLTDRRLSLEKPLVMGILNVTPDSFSDGGRYDSLDSALQRAREMREQGADIIDIGGESTRPGAEPASLEEESRRVLPVLEALVSDLGIPVSVDTSKPALMRLAIEKGAAIINDVNGFKAEGAEAAVADSGVGICVMHMRGEPRTMQQAPVYDDVLGELRDYLLERARALESRGVTRDRICIDPGFGFGKTLQHNLKLLAGMADFAQTGYPVLAGISRKSMIGALTGREVQDRLAGSLAAAVIAAGNGARILRVHDVAETVDALTVLAAVGEAGIDQ